nr:ShlB/FhaC/HecB family hemolysin secretion/activation protein [Ramlibacter agri]
MALASLAAAAWAQPASRVTPRDLRPEPPPSSSAPALPESAPQQAPAAASLQVTVAGIEVVGGYPEFVTATKQLAAPFAQRRVTVGELYKLAESLENLYRSEGYLLVRAVIPPQQLNDGGVFRINILDGFIESVDAGALPERVRDSVKDLLAPLVGQARLRNNAVERALTLAGRAPGVTLRSTLAPGTRAGGSVLVLEGEHALVAGSYAADSRLSEALGPWQGTIQLRANQPLGHGEQAYVYVSGDPNPGRMLRSEARRRVAGGGVIVPIGPDGLAFNAEYTWSDTKNPGSFYVPPTQSGFERASLRLSYPLLLTRDSEVTLTGSFDASSQWTQVPLFDLTLNQDRLRVFRLGVDAGGAVGEIGRWRASGLFSHGVSRFGARGWDDVYESGVPFSRPGAEPRFSKLEASASWEQLLKYGLSWRANVRGQHAAGGALPSAELFSLDGEDALSSFPSGTLSDDSGWTARTELARQFTLSLGDAPWPLAPYVFYAGGKPHSELGVHAGYSTSYGAGVRSNWKALSLSLEWGRGTLRPGGYAETQLFAKGQVVF